MGKVKRLLHSQPINPAPLLYPDKRSVEACESLHVHERNVRLEYTDREFAEMVFALYRAQDATQRVDLSERDEKTIYLSLTDIDPIPGVTPRRFEIEESEYPSGNTFHLHYRNLRLEFTEEEWAEFAAGIIHAEKSR